MQRLAKLIADCWLYKTYNKSIMFNIGFSGCDDKGGGSIGAPTKELAAGSQGGFSSCLVVESCRSHLAFSGASRGSVVNLPHRSEVRRPPLHSQPGTSSVFFYRGYPPSETPWETR